MTVAIILTAFFVSLVVNILVFKFGDKYLKDEKAMFITAVTLSVLFSMIIIALVG
jgi:hypothetical protein